MPKAMPEQADRVHQAPVSRAGTAYVRTRAATACQVCRARRTRCDNGRPCSYCLRIGATCSPQPDSLTPAFDPASLAILAQIEKLQSHVEALSNRLQTSPLPSPASAVANAIHGQPASGLRLHDHLHRGDLAQPLGWNVWAPHVPPHEDGAGDAEDPIGSPPVTQAQTPGADRGLDLTLFSGYLDAFFRNLHPLNPVLDEQRVRNQLTNFLLNGVGWDANSCLLLLLLANGAFSCTFDARSAGTEHGVNDEHRSASAQALFDAAEKRKDTLRRADYLTQARCHFYTGVFMMLSMRPFDAWRSFLLGLASCQRLHVHSRRQVPHEVARIETQAEESIYWSCWKSVKELSAELDVPDFGSVEYDFPTTFPSHPQVSDEHQTRAWLFYLAEISLWRMEMATRQSMSEFTKAHPAAVEALAELTEDLEKPLASWHASLPDAIRLEDDVGSEGDDVLSFVLRGRLTYIYEALTWPFLETLLLFGEHTAPRAIDLAARGVHVHYDRLLTNHRGFSYRHHGTWLMQRSSARSACILLAVARSPHTGLLPAGWADLVSATIAMLKYWSHMRENALVTFLTDVFFEVTQ